MVLACWVFNSSFLAGFSIEVRTAARIKIPSLLNMRTEHLLKIFLRCCTHNALHDLAILEEQDRRYTHNPVTTSDAWVVVSVQLAHFNLFQIAASQFLDNRTNHSAGGTPGSPKVNQDWLIRLSSLALEVLICKLK